MITVVFDLSALDALHSGDPVANGLYVEASYGHGDIIVPALVALDREERAGTMAVLADPGWTVEPLTVEHAATMCRPEYRHLSLPAAHAAACTWNAGNGERVLVTKHPELFKGIEIPVVDL